MCIRDRYGPAEIITPEEDGILVKNGNTDELADAICRLIEDTDKRIRMGKQAQKLSLIHI